MQPACAGAPSGAPKGGTYPPSVERRALAFDSTYHIARLALRRGGRCPFRTRSGHPVPARCHRFTLTRLPEPSVLVPWNRPHRGQLGWPQFRRLLPTAPSPTVAREPGGLAGAPRLPGSPQQVPVAGGCPSARSDPAPSRSPAPAPTPRRLAASCSARSEVVGGSVPAPIPLRLVGGVGRAETPSSPPRLACAFRNETQ